MDAATIILLGMAVVFGLYMAWNIGANDVANAMGTSVGSGALTLKRAIILAAIFEFAGAFLLGAHVSETVRKGIFDPRQIEIIEVQSALNLPDAPNLDELKTQAQSDPRLQATLNDAHRRAAIILACGMIAALLAAGAWLQMASYFGWPVSTTHTIVGAVFGFGAVVVGVANVGWSTLITIVASWVISPLMSGAIAYLLFRFILRRVFYRADPVSAAKQVTPHLVFFVLVVLIGVASFKGFVHVWKANDIDPKGTLAITVTTITAIIGGLIGALVARRLIRNVQSEPVDQASRFHDVFVMRSLDKALKHLRRIAASSSGPVQDRANQLLQDARDLAAMTQQTPDPHARESQYRKVERIFIFLQILSACFVAFSHGANDVANAIGPLSAAVESLQNGAIATTAHTPTWALALGGAGIVVGLATWGWRVMETIGRRITELTPSRGFCAELAAAITILIASIVDGIPVSTTHTLVGAVIGVGLARGIGAINLNTLRDIVASWIVTVPAGAGLSILIFYALRLIFVG